jgi:hypothetical protein
LTTRRYDLSTIKVAALPQDETFGMTGWTHKETIERLLVQPPKEFMIDIYEGLMLHQGPS